MRPLKRNPNTTTLVIDIGNSRIAAGYVTKNEHDHRTRIVNTYAQVHITPLLNFESDRFVRHMTEAISQALQKATATPHPPIEKAVVTLSPLLCISELRQIRVHYGDTTLITQALISGIVRKEEADLLKRFPNARLLDTNILACKLNGYRVDDPIGQKGREVALDISLSVMDEDAAAAITERVWQATHATDIEFYPATIAFLRSLDHLMPMLGQCSFVYMDSEITDIAELAEHHPKALHSLPWGRYHHVRALARALNHDSFSVAEATFGHLQENAPDHPLFREIFLNARDSWCQAWAALFGEKKFSVFVVASPSVQSYLENFLPSEQKPLTNFAQVSTLAPFFNVPHDDIPFLLGNIFATLNQANTL